MFTSPAPAPPTLSTTGASAASPTRPSRLRGLSYLRNYTHNHLHSRDTSSPPSNSSRPSTLARSTSYPTPTSTPTSTRSTTTATPAPTGQSLANNSSTALQRSTTDLQNNSSGGQEVSGPTSGWLPSVGGHTGASASSLVVLSGDVTTTSDDRDMSRTRSGTSAPEIFSDGSGDQTQIASPPATNGQSAIGAEPKYTIRFSQHQDVRAPRPSLVFSPMGRTLPTGKEIIRVGRYSERETHPNQPPNLPNAAPVGFKSKVVSRRHCEFWCENGTWYIKDVKSSSGTFLNHVRLSAPGTESKPFPVKDGDIVQLGIDFKGGEEMIFRCVKIRVELNRGWQNGLNSFNVASHKRLRNMAKQLQSPGGSSSQDCSICLGPVAPCQSLFVAPCSHTWHYKCIRRVINGPTWPHFICPNCRAVADLEADVDEPYPDGDWEDIDAALEADNSQNHDPTEVKTAAPAHTADSLERPIDGIGETSSSDERAQTDLQDDSVEEIEQMISDVQINQEEAAVPMDASASNASVAPIDIARPGRSASRRQNTSATAGGGSHDVFIGVDRTPSPSTRVVHPTESSTGGDGPMTPRNDAGPFVFDGSAGQGGAEPRMASISLAAAAAAETPPTES